METELKFQVPRAARARLHAAVAIARAQTTRLRAVYVETSGQHLAAAGLALRLRLEGDVWVQTLKGRGDGLMSRLEHEVSLPPQRGVPVLDVQRHAGTAAGDRLAAALPPGALLQTLYRTDIQRLHRRVRTGGAVIEIAYDRGWLLAGDFAPHSAGQAPSGGRRLRRRRAVDEIEFELLSGPPRALTDLATRWACAHGLWWDCRTKSEQGMRLALGQDSVPAIRASHLPLPARVGGAALLDEEQARGLAVQGRVQAALAHLLPNLAQWLDGRADASHIQQTALALQALHVALKAGAERAGAAAPALRALVSPQRWPVPEQAGSRAWWASAAAQRFLLGCLACTFSQR